MTRKRKPRTAAEVMAELDVDAEFAVRRARQEAERQQREAEYRKAETPVVNELRAAGFTVDSAWDLINRAEPYAKALPILLKHLALDYPGPVREGIARALGTRDAKSVWEHLTRHFREEKDKRIKDALAAAVEATADRHVIGDVIELARDRRHGPSRLLLLRALTRSRDPAARQALVELATDPDLKLEIEVILRRLARAKR